MTTKRTTDKPKADKPKAAVKSLTFQRGRPFKEGQSGNPGGRPKGSKSYKTKLVEEKLAELNCDPIEGMVLLAQDEATDVGIRARLFSELANYIYPKRKAVELKYKVDLNLESVLAEAHERVKMLR